MNDIGRKQTQNVTVPMERIVDEYGNTIWRMCYMYLKDKQLAEDVMQDTLIKVYEKYHTLQENGNEKAWIMKIAINTCKNYLKTNWLKCVIVGIKKDERKEKSLEEIFLTQERERELFSSILMLKNKYKDVILLFYYQEMKIREIAEILDITEATVSMRLQRARILLKNLLGEDAK